MAPEVQEDTLLNSPYVIEDDERDTEDPWLALVDLSLTETPEDPELPAGEEVIEPEDLTWWVNSDRSQQAIAEEYGIQWDGYSTLGGVVYSPEDSAIVGFKMWLEAEQYRLNSLA